MSTFKPVLNWANVSSVRGPQINGMRMCVCVCVCVCVRACVDGMNLKYAIRWHF